VLKRSIHRRFVLMLLALATLAAATIAHAQSFSVLYNFGTNAGDPTHPSFSGIIAQGRDGNLYSTAASGGANNYGAPFKITPSGTLTTLYSFKGTDGEQPQSGLTLGTDGNYYGASYGGGTSGYGTVFKVTPSGKLTVLYSFTNGSDGAYPWAPPIEGTDGNFYGTTTEANVGLGTVYKITPSGTFTSLYSFDGAHGLSPWAPLVQGTDGNFYGTTGSGGNSDYGVVYKITASGKLTVIYNFDGTHGGRPLSPLVQGSDGNFYGTAPGGTKGGGVVFRITPTGKLTVLHNINAATDQDVPCAGLVQATDGNFYGTTTGDGSTTLGTIFRISPTKPYPYRVVYKFNGTTGTLPQVTLVQHTNGILYGDTLEGGTGSVHPCSVGFCGVLYSLNIGVGPFVGLVSASGKVGKTIGILGQGFSSSSVVEFDGVKATSVRRTGMTFISATVPTGALTGSVTVTTGTTKLTGNKPFRVTPQIISFTPKSGTVGTTVTVTGVSLTQTTNVAFGGVKATTFTVNSDTQVMATVPIGAKTGKIAITTAGGTATSSGVFTVTQ
jgi:uncharacterized repeat protein (TIGR03803 family)